jgi:hypothetical protein
MRLACLPQRQGQAVLLCHGGPQILPHQPLAPAPQPLGKFRRSDLRSNLGDLTQTAVAIVHCSGGSCKQLPPHLCMQDSLRQLEHMLVRL